MKGLWVSVSGAVAQQQKIDTLANNIANANTTGFKKDDITFKEHLTVLDNGGEDIHIPRKDWSAKDFYHTQGQEQAKVKYDASHTDFTQGQITPTNNALDVAIEGKGFFELSTPQGILYSRSGEMTIDSEGHLTNKQGNYFLKPGDGAAEERRIKIDSSITKINIDKNGTISDVNGTPISSLSVKEFVNNNFVEKVGNGFFQTPSENISTEKISSIIHQGNVEQSNVNPIVEMSELIKANRQFESIQRAIKSYDSITGRGVNEIAKF